ncbi:MAG: TIGR03084 family protein [Rhodobacteraceae bacterium]|nr:MAG: TIGR03084 family protein [Paracoccaceae bacterium]
MEQVEDFLKESKALHDLMVGRKKSDFRKITQFKDWAISDVFGHLYIFNLAAIKTLESSLTFDSFFKPIWQGLEAGQSFLEVQTPFLKNYDDLGVFEIWWKSCLDIHKAYSEVDPKRRVKWAGPEMSARSSITARQMETWAHGHEIFDCLGISRREEDYIENIVHMGVSTFGWTFVNRQLPVPGEAPYVSLILPSGKFVSYNEESNSSFVKGDAVDFCQVVTQTRNILDTSLKIKGEAARQWMNLAQCFAGRPEDPPRRGQRYKKL